MDNFNLEENETEEYYIPSEDGKKDHRFALGFSVGVIVALVLGIGINLGILFLTTGGVSKKDTLASDKAAMGKLTYIENLIKRYYYQDIDQQTLEDGMYDGLMGAMGDPYSAYYNEKDYQQLLIDLTGDYAGVGMLLSKNATTGIVTVSKVYSGTPADEAGIKAGDIIISADGYDATEEELDTFVLHIRGQEGTPVDVEVSRAGEKMTFTCERRMVSVPTVEHKMLNDEVGLVTISQFTGNTYDEFTKAIEDLETQGMTKVVFDLRSNGGGLLNAVCDMLDYLLPKGTVVSIKDKNGKEEVFTSDAERFLDMPMVVLTNGYTASASEIFAGAIRDYNYGTLVGTNTFGKGIVQSTMELNDGSAIKLTTATYYTPSGECIHGKGIAPDVELEYEFLGGEDDEYTEELDNQIQKALEILTK